MERPFQGLQSKPVAVFGRKGANLAGGLGLINSIKLYYEYEINQDKIVPMTDSKSQG